MVSFVGSRKFMRYQYLSWNAIGLMLLYILPDSLINVYYLNNGYFKIILHSFQLISIIAFFISHYSNPGKVTKRRLKYNNTAESKSICNICNVSQPLHTKHCKKCNFCVLQFDHHCEIVANCIGAYNHNYYKFFLITQFITVFLGFYISFYNLFGETYFKSNTTSSQNPIIIILKYTPIYWLPLFWIEFIKIIVCTFKLDFKQFIFDCDNFPHKPVWNWLLRILLFIGLLVPLVLLFGLIVWHIYLFCINKTTFQVLKGNKKRIKTDHSETV